MSWPADGNPRFVVTELDGNLGGGSGGSKGGVSVTIVDRANCCRVFAMWRTEDMWGNRLARLRLAREAAAETLAALNLELVAA